MEEFTLFLARRFDELHYEGVFVFAGPMVGEFKQLFDGTSARVDYFKRSGRLRDYIALWRLLRKYKPDIVHFHFYGQFSLAPISAWLAGPRQVIFTDHDRRQQPLRKITKLKCLLWDRIVLRLLRVKVCAVSEHIKRTLVQDYQMRPERVEVVLNGVNVPRFQSVTSSDVSSLRQQLAIPQDGPVIVCTAALRPDKGVRDFLDAAKHVLAVKPDVCFVVVGDGPLAGELKDQARRLGIEKSTLFVGLRSDVQRFMAMSQIVAVPSDWPEPAGLVVVEGMASARPVVATRVGGIPEYLADGRTGLLVPPHSPPELAQAFLRLLDSPDEAKAMGEAGRARVREKFTVQRWVSDTLRIYDEVA
jgi:glycosyltransferase involved in cell wall biosynthesis